MANPGEMTNRTLSLLVTLFCISCGCSADRGWFYYRKAADVVQNYKLVFKEPPKKTPGNVSVDAPLMGNGSFGVAIGGDSGHLLFYLARNDFWRLISSYNESFPCVLGKLEVKIPALKGADYLIEQDLYTGTSLLTFTKDDHCLEIKTYVHANEDLLLMELENRGSYTLVGEMNLLTPGDEIAGFPCTMSREVDGDLQWISRQFDREVDIPTKAACALRMFDVSSPRFYLGAGKTLYVAGGSSSNFKTDDCTDSVVKRVKDIKKHDFIDFLDAHEEWWARYWNKSFVMLGDPVLEKAYYRALYTMGSASRDLHFPPGIFGTWITGERPEWNGDYHLNYNHQAPYYGLFSANRIEQALPYNYPIIAMSDRARRYAKEYFGIDGIYMPVGIGPRGIDTTYSGPGAGRPRQFYLDHGFVDAGALCFHQRSNALHCINNMAMLCYYTYDREYIELVYPFIKGVVAFWEQYLKYEDGRYVAYYDAVHEGPNGDTNNTMTLGFLRNALQTLIDMARELGRDQDKIPLWKNILAELSDYATYEKNGKTYLADSERGYFATNHPVLLQIVFPGGQIHKDSDPALLQMARNCANADASTNLWNHELHTSSNYPSAVRLGFDPNTILSQLRKFVSTKFDENGFLKDSPVGIENCSAVVTTINEMLLRSRPGVIDVFPVWNMKHNAIFQDLRAEGAFLVSSRVVGGGVAYIKLTSERGRDCHVVNPWTREGVKTLSILRNGREIKMDAGDRFTLPTSPGDVIIIKPWDMAQRTLE